MGLCLGSKEKPNDFDDEETRFKVVNLNDNGKKICPGVMELTETSLIFYLKKGGMVRWPYYSLVKYGFDSNIFSFMSGTRCQTGEGIFGFKCDRAEELFNRLQDNMQNNRISVISDTDHDSPTGVPPEGRVILYRYERYPSFPTDSNTLSSLQRPEPIGGEIFPEPAAPNPAAQLYMNTMPTEDQMRQRGHLLLTKKSSSGGTSLNSRHSYLEIDDPLRSSERQSKTYQRPTYIYRNQLEKEELERLGSLYANVDSSQALWDTGYDSEERREASVLKSIGVYENIGAPSSESESRSLVVSVSSSGSQSINLVPPRAPLGGYESQPSSPSVFEEKYILEQKTQSSMNEATSSRHQLSKRHSIGRDSLTRQDWAVNYFNFDLRQPPQDSKKLNYIQVEMESGCDSDNPQTPQSPDTSTSLVTTHQSEVYAELDLEKMAALSQIHRFSANDDGTRKTRHSFKHLPV
ncbi:fibroblast growth factor receptor substrate 2-like [Discoglossus pictus]